MIYITGDKHRKYKEFGDYLNFLQVTQKDIVVMLGDVGINFYNGKKDIEGKEYLNSFPCTFLCIHGNHEMRPWHVRSNYKKEWNSGHVYVDDDYPRILFAVDGSIFDLNGKKAIVIGGAYSPDKFYRLANGIRWFADEQPDEFIMEYVERQLKKVEYKVDYVFSHTTPYKYIPKECFVNGIDNSTVDHSTEKWLDTIEEKLDYKNWYCGHYHTEKKVDKVIFLYEKVKLL